MNPYRTENWLPPAVPGMGPQNGPRKSPTSGRLVPTTSVDHLRTSADQTIKAHRGSGHAKRFGVKPNSGRVADIHAGPVVVEPAMYLREAIELAKDRPGREIRLVQQAADVIAGDVRDRQIALKREFCKLECEALKGYPMAEKLSEAVSKALGF